MINFFIETFQTFPAENISSEAFNFSFVLISIDEFKSV